MPQTTYTSNDKFLWFVTFAFLAFNSIGGKAEGGAAVLFVVTIIFLLCSNFRFQVRPYHLFVLQFTFFCYISAFWALNGRMAIAKGNTLFQILFCTSVFYSYYSKLRNVDLLLRLIMWAGYFMVFYSYLFYGIGNVASMESDAERLSSEFANVNSIGMKAATVVIIHLYFCMYRKWERSILLAIPTIILVASTQSRKAIVILILGPLLLYYFKYLRQSRKSLVPFARLLLFVIVLIILVITMSQTGLFSGVTQRMTNLLNSFTGEGYVDSSTSTREFFRKIGWIQFTRTPMLGVGMGNARILAIRATGHDCYLHNNYAELAANGGTVGLISYYSIFLYVLYKEFKYYKVNSVACLFIVMILIRFVSDWGAVSYYSKTTYIYLMMWFIHLDKCKKWYPKRK